MYPSLFDFYHVELCKGGLQPTMIISSAYGIQNQLSDADGARWDWVFNEDKK
jgi:hypothetical protein